MWRMCSCNVGCCVDLDLGRVDGAVREDLRRRDLERRVDAAKPPDLEAADLEEARVLRLARCLPGPAGGLAPLADSPFAIAQGADRITEKTWTGLAPTARPKSAAGARFGSQSTPLPVLRDARR